MLRIFWRMRPSFRDLGTDNDIDFDTGRRITQEPGFKPAPGAFLVRLWMMNAHRFRSYETESLYMIAKGKTTFLYLSTLSVEFLISGYSKGATQCVWCWLSSTTFLTWRQGCALKAWTQSRSFPAALMICFHCRHSIPRARTLVGHVERRLPMMARVPLLSTWRSVAPATLLSTAASSAKWKIGRNVIADGVKHCQNSLSWRRSTTAPTRNMHCLASSRLVVFGEFLKKAILYQNCTM